MHLLLFANFFFASSIVFGRSSSSRSLNEQIQDGNILTKSASNTVTISQPLFDTLSPVMMTILQNSINTFEMEDIEHGVYVPLVGQIGFSATEIRAGNCLFSNINPRGIVIRDGKVEIDFEQLNFDVNANYQIHYGLGSFNGSVVITNSATVNAEVFFIKQDCSSITTKVRNLKTPYAHFDVQVFGSHLLSWAMTAVQALFKGIIKSMLGRVLKVFMNVALIPILSTVFNSQLSVGIGSSIGDHTLSSAIIAEPIVSEKDGIVIAFDIQVD